MDLTDELEQSDSGMESLTASKDDTPERKPEDSALAPATLDLDVNDLNLKAYEDEPEETLSERLWGLTEMFPDSLRCATYILGTKTLSSMKVLYGVSRSVMWVIASSSVILFAPVIFEVERSQVEEMQKSQQKQVLLGTNTVGVGGPLPNLPPIPRSTN